MNGQQIFDVIYVIVAFNMGIFVVIPALILTPMGLTHPTVMLQTGLILATAVFFFRVRAKKKCGLSYCAVVKAAKPL